MTFDALRERVRVALDGRREIAAALRALTDDELIELAAGVSPAPAKTLDDVAKKHAAALDEPTPDAVTVGRPAVIEPRIVALLSDKPITFGDIASRTGFDRITVKGALSRLRRNAIATSTSQGWILNATRSQPAEAAPRNGAPDDIGPRRTKIREALANGPRFLTQLVIATGLDARSISGMLGRLKNCGEVRPLGSGRWELVDEAIAALAIEEGPAPAGPVSTPEAAAAPVLPPPLPSAEPTSARAAILASLAQGPLSWREIVKATGLSSGTVSGMCASLMSRGDITRDADGYRLAPPKVAAAVVAVAGEDDVDEPVVHRDLRLAKPQPVAPRPPSNDTVSRRDAILAEIRERQPVRWEALVTTGAASRSRQASDDLIWLRKAGLVLSHGLGVAMIVAVDPALLPPPEASDAPGLEVGVGDRRDCLLSSSCLTRFIKADHKWMDMPRHERLALKTQVGVADSKCEVPGRCPEACAHFRPLSREERFAHATAGGMSAIALAERH